jgi:methionyl-tRNA formyltransferase
MNSQKIVMCGCIESGWEMVNSLLKNGICINHFVCIAPEKAKSAHISGYKDFRDLATHYNIPVYYAEKYSLKSENDIAFFKNHSFDLLIQGGWQRLFPQEILSTLNIGAIGVHGSSEFLPKGRGRSPINWSLIEGKKRFIIHYFLIKPGVDDGDIFHYDIFDINAWDDCATLYLKNSICSSRALINWIPRLLNGNYTLMPQLGNPTYYPKRNAGDGLIDWSKSVFTIYNFIRAITQPYPGAFSFVNGKKIIIWRAQPFDTRITYSAAVEGEVVEIFSNNYIIINCNSGLLLITKYKSDCTINIGDVLKNE